MIILIDRFIQTTDYMVRTHDPCLIKGPGAWCINVAYTQNEHWNMHRERPVVTSVSCGTLKYQQMAVSSLIVSIDSVIPGLHFPVSLTCFSCLVSYLLPCLFKCLSPCILDEVLFVLVDISVGISSSSDVSYGCYIWVVDSLFLFAVCGVYVCTDWLNVLDPLPGMD